MNAALRFRAVKVDAGVFLKIAAHTWSNTSASSASMLGVFAHIALDALLAAGHPLDAAPLFALNSLGGLNCTKVSLTFALVVLHQEVSSDINQVPAEGWSHSFVSVVCGKNVSLSLSAM